jgi:hypothetical protein
MPPCNHHRCRARRKFSDSPGPTGLDSTDPAEVAGRFFLTSGESLLDASGKRTLVLVFLRHFGCTFTRQILRGLEELLANAKSHDAELVIVHMLGKGGESPYLGGHDGVARIADPNRELYRAFGLGKGGFRELFGLHVLWLAAVSIFKGCGVGHLAGDGRQMPGAFLFRNGRITASQRARSASDMPDLTALFEAIPHAARS